MQFCNFAVTRSSLPFHLFHLTFRRIDPKIYQDQARALKVELKAETIGHQANT